VHALATGWRNSGEIMTKTTDRGLTESGARPAHRAVSRATATEDLSRADRAARGKDARALTPLDSQAEFSPDRRRDPTRLLLDQDATRVPELVPLRHGRMLVSPFAYYRGAALPMAADLATTPVSGLRVQLCGDAHLSNFGAFASPERNLVFDVNDFDETLPGPFEWDVKRLAASLAVAGRDNSYRQKARRQIVLAAVKAYRTAMLRFAALSFLDVWYAHLDVEGTLNKVKSELKTSHVRATEAMISKAHTHDSMQALGKLTTVTDGHRRIVSDPPTIVPVEELYPDLQVSAIYEQIQRVLGKYKRTLETDRRHLLVQFRLVQVARKVVGVGSVGTRAWIALMQAEETEPLFLQAKEAQESVLARFCGRSQYASHGERVVAGQHLMQAESDIFLGWTRAADAHGVDRDFYVRQLRDWKFSAPIEQMNPTGMRMYATMCGWTLARAHARSGDRIALASYLGRSRAFDHALADFAETYAEQTEEDFSDFQTAARDGTVPYTTDI
jgi:uncharacterized protein (DUF2252 family)